VLNFSPLKQKFPSLISHLLRAHSTIPVTMVMVTVMVTVFLCSSCRHVVQLSLTIPMRPLLDVGGQFHAPADLTPGERTWYPLNSKLGGPLSRCGRSGEEKNFLSFPRTEKCFCSPVHVSHYTNRTSSAAPNCHARSYRFLRDLVLNYL
jgi:hypothetical protein